MSEKQLTIMGWIGTALSVIMYISYVPQIMGNLHGHKTFFSIWTAYGLLKEKRDYPVSAANFPGVVFGLIATITAF